MNPQKTKRWTLVTCILFLAVLVACALTVYIVDPFQIYRKASFYVPYIENTTQNYTNAGIVRNYEYDSAMVGTSMTENFRPTQLDELFGGHFIKLCSSGGSAYNHALLMRIAFETHDIKRILYGFDMYSFVGGTQETSSDIPMYLYDSNPLNDVYYLLNRDVLLDRLKELYEYNKTTPYSAGDDMRDDMYAWGTHYAYSEEAVLASYTMSDPPAAMLAYDTYQDQALENLEENLISFITAHPETEFDIFFPPYSELEWYVMYLKGHLDFVLNIKDLCAERLLELPNVKLYDFNTHEEWVRNLSLYKDYSHYAPEINDALAQAIADDENRVNDIYDIYEHDELIYTWVDEALARFQSQ